MSKNRTIDKVWKTVTTVAIVAVFLYSIERITYTYVHLNFYPEQTTGKITELGRGFRGNKQAYYVFHVREKEYRGETKYASNLNPEIGDIYSVIYSWKDPNVCRMKVTEHPL